MNGWIGDKMRQWGPTPYPHLSELSTCRMDGRTGELFLVGPASEADNPPQDEIGQDPEVLVPTRLGEWTWVATPEEHATRRVLKHDLASLLLFVFFLGALLGLICCTRRRAKAASSSPKRGKFGKAEVKVDLVNSPLVLGTIYKVKPGEVTHV